MSQPESAAPKNKKTLYVMSAIGLVVMGALAFALTRPQPGLVTTLYKYYPENTAFFMEIAPGEQLASRVVRGLDRLKQPGGIDSLHTVFTQDFEPELSAGMWAPATPTTTAKEEAPFLAVLTLKPGITPERLTQDLHTTMDAFEVEKVGDATLLTSKTPGHPSMAFHQNHLLSAHSTDILKQALAEWQTPATLMDNPLYHKSLALLPRKRVGTVLALSQEFQKFPQDARTQAPGFKPLTDLQTQMTAATPVTVCGITTNGKQLVALDVFTPVDLAQIANTGLRKDLRSLYLQQSNVNLAKLMPKETIAFGGMSGLGTYYDLYINYLANAQGKQTVENIQSQLKMIGLDLRKNLVSLVDGNSGIGITSQGGQPDVLVFLNDTPDTMKTMEQISALASQMLRGQVVDKQVDSSHSLKVVQIPGLPVKAAYGTLQKGTLVVGTQGGIETLFGVQGKKTPAIAENTLYQELTTDMPRETHGVFFVDVAQGGALLDKQRDQTGNTSQQMRLTQLLSGIEGLAGSNTLEGEHMIHGHLSVKLTPDGPTTPETP